jgi:formylglycine-generating enzyme required for sulfatase activity
MKNILLFLLFILGATKTQAQPLVKMSPKVEKPKVEAKTKIIYVDKSAKKMQSASKTSIELEMVFIEGGTFSMGSNESSEEKPIHSVALSSFKMGKYEVTVAQYKAYCKDSGTQMPKAPSWGWKDTHPMVNINFDDANAYCNWMSEKTGKDYRLPTEAEWEFAARGGNNSNNYTYSGSNDLEQVGWSTDNSGGSTQACGRKSPNELGLYDMSGNVSEWCKDWYDPSYYSNSPSSNPRGPSYGFERVLRGCSWYYLYSNCRVAYRYNYPPSYRFDHCGFRVVLSQ